jgi:hypothetical protein
LEARVHALLPKQRPGNPEEDEDIEDNADNHRNIKRNQTVLSTEETSAGDKL